MPERFPRVGDRPAGAELGAALPNVVLSLEMGDLGCRVRREAREDLGLASGRDSERDRGVLAAEKLLVLRTKEEEGFSRSWLAPEEPLERLAKRRGSTFSESSTSRSSALRLPAEAG